MIFPAQLSRLVAAGSVIQGDLCINSYEPKHGQSQRRRKTNRRRRILSLTQLLFLCDTHILHGSTHTHTHTQTDKHTFTSQVDQHNPGISVQRGQITAIKISKCSCSLSHRVKLLKTRLTWWSLWAEKQPSLHNVGLPYVRACVRERAHA